MSTHSTVNPPRGTVSVLPERVYFDVDLDHFEEVRSASASAGELVADESLVEEVSIDGMCGVY